MVLGCLRIIKRERERVVIGSFERLETGKWELKDKKIEEWRNCDVRPFLSKERICD